MTTARHKELVKEAQAIRKAQKERFRQYLKEFRKEFGRNPTMSDMLIGMVLFAEDKNEKPLPKTTG